MARILLAGESWSTTSIHTKGFDSFLTSSYEEGGGHFIAALRRGGHQVDYQPNHVAAEHFPRTSEALDEFDVVVLSDIGSNTLLLPRDVFIDGRPVPNRLGVLADWVRAGGALLMVGGYLSFSGIEGKANYRATPLAQILPIVMEAGDDREETPQGVRPHVVLRHPAVARVSAHLPAILGFQRFWTRPAAETLIAVDGWPLLAVGHAGRGRVAAFASDMGPHWLAPEFLAWEGYDPLWQDMVTWLAGDEDTR